ncbi:MAG TPA: PaaI family thioesterase [Candidatus Limnocylindria bacterium]|nr:PaaI family thioesterase [Candidatus Limnocylindria bacterium]
MTSRPTRPEFAALSAADRERILDGFNRNNQAYFGGYLGYRCVDVRPGWARLEVENRTALMNPVGVMHGGASFGLADSAVAAALMTIYGIGTHALLTIEMKINYLEPIPAGLVAAEATVLRASRRSAYAEVDVLAAGRLAARASTTYMIRPLPAAG